jgi:hypothetical protein
MLQHLLRTMTVTVNYYAKDFHITVTTLLDTLASDSAEL